MLGKEKSSLIHTNMNGDTPRELAGEFAAIRRAKPQLQKACAHMILSVAHRDIDHPKGELHEHLTDEQYAQIGSRYLQEMEFVGEEELASSLFVIVRHGDRSHEHIHIIASRIRMDGEVVSDSWDWYRSEVAARKLEKEFG
ncbi:MAG: relaxase/mobilization nuclease domain-containing protein, partial [Rivularia sp. (in: cyanobacteria)]